MKDQRAKKTCLACRKKLSAAAFNGSQRTADGLANKCRACTNARRRLLDASRKPRRLPTDNFARALRHDDIKAVRTRLRKGVKPHWSWVCETMRNGHFALAAKLLESGVERNIYTMAAIADAAAVTRRLRQVPADARRAESMEPSSDRVTPLHVACSSDFRPCGPNRMADQTKIVKEMTLRGGDLHARARYRGIDDATPLFCACWSSGNVTLVRWLLDHGSQPSDEQLLAALGHFQRHGRPCFDIAEELLTCGLSVDGSVAGARTPLQAFAHQAAHRTVAWLIAHGADVNARIPGGRTAAHLAAERNTGPTTLALLVANGADLSLQDEDGDSPLDVARRNQKLRLVAWIKRHRAKRG